MRLLLRIARSSEVSDLVHRGDALLGLRYFADPRPEVLCSLLVMHEPLQIVSSAQSRLFVEIPTEPVALQGIPWINFPTGSSGEPFARLLAQQLLQHSLKGAEMITIDSLTAQRRLIEADFGLGSLPASSIEEELHLGTMQVLSIAALQTTVPVMLISRCQGYLSRAVRRLREMLTSPKTNL